MKTAVTVRKDLTMATKRGRYQSKQRRLILEHLKLWRNDFLSAEEIQQRMIGAGVKVGLTTIYRTLDMLEEDRLVVKVPGIDGVSARYRYIGEAQEETSPYGRLHCRECGRSMKLNCDHIDDFFHHIEEEHHFKINRQQTLFYGTCEDCQKKQNRM